MLLRSTCVDGSMLLASCSGTLSNDWVMDEVTYGPSPGKAVHQHRPTTSWWRQLPHPEHNTCKQQAGWKQGRDRRSPNLERRGRGRGRGGQDCQVRWKLWGASVEVTEVVWKKSVVSFSLLMQTNVPSSVELGRNKSSICSTAAVLNWRRRRTHHEAQS